MKASIIIPAFFVLTILTSCQRDSNNPNQTVNPIIGDIGYVETFGQTPDEESNENLRILTHLKHVEKLLRGKDISTLTDEQKQSRLKILDLLSDYWTAGVFPKNYEYPDQRTPCFIDKDGTICAVGYLIEQTAGREVAEEINAAFKYEKLLAMNDPAVDSWVQASGLSKEECAMIQPTYGYTPVQEDHSPAYGISTAVFSGVNVSLSAINGIQFGNGSSNRTAPIIGLIAGAGQITLGAVNYPGENSYANEYQSKRNLSLVNIGIGTSTMILSCLNLILDREPNDKTLSWNVYSFPARDSNVGVGFSITKRL